MTLKINQSIKAVVYASDSDRLILLMGGMSIENRPLVWTIPLNAGTTLDWDDYQVYHNVVAREHIVKATQLLLLGQGFIFDETIRTNPAGFVSWAAQKLGLETNVAV